LIAIAHSLHARELGKHSLEAESPTIKWSSVIHRFVWRSVFHPEELVNDDREAVAAFGGGPKGHH
jgi:hypothetical protein